MPLMIEPLTLLSDVPGDLAAAAASAVVITYGALVLSVRTLYSRNVAISDQSRRDGIEQALAIRETTATAGKLTDMVEKLVVANASLAEEVRRVNQALAEERRHA